MEKGRRLLEQLAQDTELDTELLPRNPIVEISGSERVLIENHFGVMGYSRERIMVKVGYGCVCVSGCGLELLRMTCEQLVIRGRIDGVTLHRRGRA